MKQKQNEIYSLNSLKAVCCIIVILFHCPIPGVVGNLIHYFLRFPVPIFFMISGYFCKFDVGSYRRRIIETIKYIILGELLYVAVRCVIVLTHGGNPMDVILLEMSAVKLIKTILFGTFYNGPLWSLYALLWTWVLLYGVSKVCHKSGISIPFRLQLGVVIGILVILIFGWTAFIFCTDIQEWVWIFRSSILFALPFMWIGKNIRKFEYILLERFKPKKCILCILGAYILATVEVMIFYHYHMALEIYLSTIPICFFMFLMSLHFKGTAPSFLSQLGKKYSAYVYLCHGAAIRIAECIFTGVLRPILVIILSFGLAIFIYYIRAILKNYKRGLSKRLSSHELR